VASSAVRAGSYGAMIVDTTRRGPMRLSMPVQISVCSCPVLAQRALVRFDMCIKVLTSPLC
jgi:hypothetical protein